MAEIKVGCLAMGVLDTNTYFLHKDGEYDCIIIDPACDGEMLVTKLREKGLTIKAIILTHAHFDHIMGVEGILKLNKVPVYGGKKDVPVFLDPELNQGYRIRKNVSVTIDKELSEGDVVDISGMKFRVYETPGHTAGGICLHFEEDKLLFSGDTLFMESCGRTDFETGSASDMRESIARLLELPEDTKVYPGHGEFTTIEHEKKYNPYAF